MDLRGRKLFCEDYWMRIKHVDQDTVVYDSFTTDVEGKIIPIGRDLKSSLSDVLADVENGDLQIE